MRKVVILRLPAELHQAVKAAAKRQRVSLNAYRTGRAAPAERREVMDAKEQEALSEAANAMRVAALLATRVRKSTVGQADDSVQLEAAINRATGALRRLLRKEGQ